VNVSSFGGKLDINAFWIG